MAAKTPAKKSSKRPQPAAKAKKAVKKSAPKSAPKSVKKAAPKQAVAKRAAAAKPAKPARPAKSAKSPKSARPVKAARTAAAAAKAAKAPARSARSVPSVKSAKPAKVSSPSRTAKLETPAPRTSRPPAAPAPRPTARAKTPAAKGGVSRDVKAAVPAGARAGIDMEAYRAHLLHRREDLLRMYRNDLRLGQEASDEPTEDIVDRANNSYTRELSFSISDAERTRVLQIDAALGRIDKGTFGRCGHCGREIPLQRLEALPWAHLCVDCQELLEKGLLADA